MVLCTHCLFAWLVNVSQTLGRPGEYLMAKSAHIDDNEQNVNEQSTKESDQLTIKSNFFSIAASPKF